MALSGLFSESLDIHPLSCYYISDENKINIFVPFSVIVFIGRTSKITQRVSPKGDQDTSKSGNSRTNKSVDPEIISYL